MTFGVVLGLKQGSLSDVYRAKGGLGVSDSIKRILDKEFSINIDWLETGEGEMLKPTNNKNKISSTLDYSIVPLLPISAQGGSLNDFTLSINNNDLEQVVSPIKNVDFVMPVSGDSMAPEYPSGSYIYKEDK